MRSSSPGMGGTHWGCFEPDCCLEGNLHTVLGSPLLPSGSPASVPKKPTGGQEKPRLCRTDVWAVSNDAFLGDAVLCFSGDEAWEALYSKSSTEKKVGRGLPGACPGWQFAWKNVFGGGAEKQLCSEDQVSPRLVCARANRGLF